MSTPHFMHHKNAQITWFTRGNAIFCENMIKTIKSQQAKLCSFSHGDYFIGYPLSYDALLQVIRSRDKVIRSRDKVIRSLLQVIRSLLQVRRSLLQVIRSLRSLLRTQKWSTWSDHLDHFITWSDHLDHFITRSDHLDHLTKWSKWSNHVIKWSKWSDHVIKWSKWSDHFCARKSDPITFVYAKWFNHLYWKQSALRRLTEVFWNSIWLYTENTSQKQ